MTNSGAAFYLLGVPDCAGPHPASVEVPQVYLDEELARDSLPAVMTLSRMAHGDAVADATSWYLLEAMIGKDVEPTPGDLALGYVFEDGAIQAIAGGFAELSVMGDWQPFVCELERERAHRAGLPWRPADLETLSAPRLAASGPSAVVRYDHFRFAPVAVDLLVRPLDLNETLLLF